MGFLGWGLTKQIVLCFNDGSINTGGNMDLKDMINKYTGRQCVCCNEVITHQNVATESGCREVGISGMCEVCFDNIFENWCFWKLDPLVAEVVQSLDNVVLAGGAMRALVDIGDTICDYDLFVTDLSALEPLKNRLTEAGFNLVFECPEGKLFTYKNEDVKVQVINNRQYVDVYDLINSFDITACCAAWDGEQVYKNRRFVFDVLNKRINLNKIEYPKATLNRLMKYSQKGYRMSREANEYFFDVVANFEWTDENGRFYID